MDSTIVMEKYIKIDFRHKLPLIKFLKKIFFQKIADRNQNNVIQVITKVKRLIGQLYIYDII